MSSADSQNDRIPDGGAPAGDDVQDYDYVSQKEGPIPVQSDGADISDSIDAAGADSDEQLAKDDDEAIDQSNVIKERTRHAKPSSGYREPGDDEGLPGAEDGTSRVVE